MVFIFYKNELDPLETLIRHRIQWHLIRVCTVCLCICLRGLENLNVVVFCTNINAQHIEVHHPKAVQLASVFVLDLFLVFSYLFVAIIPIN